MLRYIYWTAYTVGHILYMSICMWFLIPCHHDTMRPQIAALEDELQKWAAATSVLNKQIADSW